MKGEGVEQAKGRRWPQKTLMVSASGLPDSQDPSHRPTGATMGASSAHGFIRCSGGHQGRIGKMSSGGFSSTPWGLTSPLNRKGFILPRQTWCSLPDPNCVKAFRGRIR